MTADVRIEPATEADLPAILDIYNEVIANTTAIYLDALLTLDNRRAWFNERRQKNYPVLVARIGDKVAGMSSFGDFRVFPDGYRFTVEHTVLVHAGHRGHGLGPRLVEALFAPARALNKHVMVGAIDAGNTGSIRFHQKLGFIEVGRMPEVGCKDGKWLDLVYMQKRLADDASGTA